MHAGYFASSLDRDARVKDELSIVIGHKRGGAGDGSEEDIGEALDQGVKADHGWLLLDLNYVHRQIT